MQRKIDPGTVESKRVYPKQHINAIYMPILRQEGRIVKWNMKKLKNGWINWS